MIYLDSAATSLRKPDDVYAAVLRAMINCAGVGRSGHDAALRAAEQVYQCREMAGKMFDASPEQVAFTFNATHGLNIAIQSLVSRGDRVVISGFEHNAVLRPLHHIGANIIVAGRNLFQPDETLYDFDQKITPETKAVICTHVSNVFGYVLPVNEIAVICHDRGVPFVLDASQSAGVLPVSLENLHAAYIAMPGHKGLLGPQGTGILLCGSYPKTILQGGTGSNSRSVEMPDFLPDRIEAGTHNVAGICGLYEGLKYINSIGLDSIAAHETNLQEIACKALCDKFTVFHGSNHNQTGVISFLMEGVDCETVASRLARHDVAVRAGLHCAPLAHESAGTIEQGTVRISFSPFTTVDELREFLQIAQNELVV